MNITYWHEKFFNSKKTKLYIFNNVVLGGWVSGGREGGGYFCCWNNLLK